MQRKFHLESSVGDNVILVIVGIEGEQSSEDSRDVVNSIRDLESKNVQFDSQSTVSVAGIAAYNQDILEAVAENMPIALVFILISSYILIFLQVRSVVLPLKALVMNVPVSYTHLTLPTILLV